VRLVTQRSQFLCAATLGVGALMEVRRLGGAATLGDLLARGVSRRALGKGIALGQIERPLRGVYCVPGTDLRLVRATRLNAPLTCVSACELLGLPLLNTDARAHVAVRRSTSVSLGAGVRPHYVSEDISGLPINRVQRRLSRTDAVGGRRLPVWRIVDHLGACVPHLDQLVVLDAVLNRKWMSLGEVNRFTCTPPARVHWLREHADARAQSVIETLSRFALGEAGLEVESQVLVEGVGHVDLVVDGVLAVELDGRDHHSDERAFYEDRRRDRELALRGMAVMRFTYRDVRYRTDQMVAEVRAMCQLLTTRGLERR